MKYLNELFSKFSGGGAKVFVSQECIPRGEEVFKKEMEASLENYVQQKLINQMILIDRYKHKIVL